MTPTAPQGHFVTPAAMRAAESIAARINAGERVTSGQIAAIIDRETGLADMIAAFEETLNMCERGDKVPVAMLRAAIAKARGGER